MQVQSDEAHSSDWDCASPLQGASPEKSLQLQKTRIILDDEGIKRLEPGGHNHLQRTRRPRLPAAADALRRIRFRSSTEAPLKAD